MSQDAIKLYEPINVLKQVGEEIWIVDGAIVQMSMYGVSVPFPTRMTIVRLSSGELWCHSPTALNQELKSQVDALGSVRHLISPNKLHYAHIRTWAKAYPEATTWASPGVRDRAAQQKIEVSFDADLEQEPPSQWVMDLDQLIFRGSWFMEEVVFFHRRSATLILADLIENFEPDKVNKWYRWLLQRVGSADPDGKAPLDLRMTFWGHHQQSRLCLKRIFQWNPERVIFSHGRWYEQNGTAELHRAFRWLE
ncbi:MAG TPA: DUF4336 domain-containing protein [Leptolyngbya sp.]|nr:DUF4336 domain-containing protein [Leptolyngbya sp.]